MSTGTDCGAGFCNWIKDAFGIWNASDHCVNNCLCNPDPGTNNNLPDVEFQVWAITKGITVPAGANMVRVGCYKLTLNHDG